MTDAATNGLARAGDAHPATDREWEWQPYLSDVLDRHRDEYTLVRVVNALK
jgi:hypothetical protein